MGYIVVALVSFLFGYALCFKWLGEDIIKGKFNGSTIDSVSGTITDNNDYNVSFSANKQ